jgi:hypothetical protein
MLDAAGLILSGGSAADLALANINGGPLEPAKQRL